MPYFVAVIHVWLLIAPATPFFDAAVTPIDYFRRCLFTFIISFLSLRHYCLLRRHYAAYFSSFYFTILTTALLCQRQMLLLMSVYDARVDDDGEMRRAKMRMRL